MMRINGKTENAIRPLPVMSFKRYCINEMRSFCVFNLVFISLMKPAAAPKLLSFLNVILLESHRLSAEQSIFFPMLSVKYS